MDRDELNRALGLTESELNELAQPFEEGTWDASPYAPPHRGRPTSFGETMQTITFKETPTIVRKIDERAKNQGMTRSDYLRALIAADLALV